MRTLELSKYTATLSLVALRERRAQADQQLGRIDSNEPADRREIPDVANRIAYYRDVIRQTNEAIEEIRNAWGAP
jgi:hypothetical protein